MAIDTKFRELEPSMSIYVAVIRGESYFEKNAFEDTENPHPPTKTRLAVKEYLGKYSRYRKISCFVLKLFLRPILFHGKLSFDNLTYFKLYGSLKPILSYHPTPFRPRVKGSFTFQNLL